MNSQYIGKPIDSIPVPDCCAILGLVRQDNLILAASNPVIEEEDYLIAVAMNPQILPELKHCLNRTQQLHWKPT